MRSTRRLEHLKMGASDGSEAIWRVPHPGRQITLPSWLRSGYVRSKRHVVLAISSGRQGLMLTPDEADERIKWLKVGLRGDRVGKRLALLQFLSSLLECPIDGRGRVWVPARSGSLLVTSALRVPAADFWRRWAGDGNRRRTGP